MMIFKKKKMMARLQQEGRADNLPPEVYEIMDNLDGQPATTNSWQRQVYGQPVLWCTGKDGKGYEVNEADCE